MEAFTTFGIADITESLKGVSELLKYGLIGLGALLSILTFWLIVVEQRKEKVRLRMMSVTALFMIFSLLVLFAGIISEASKASDLHAEEFDLPETESSMDSSSFSSAHFAMPTSSTTQVMDLYADEELWLDMAKQCDAIDTLFVCGAHLQNGVGRILNVITGILKNGGTVYTLVTDPTDSISIALQCDRRDPPTGVMALRGQIAQTIKDLTIIKNDVSSGSLYLRTIKRPLDERIHVIFRSEDSDMAYMKLYPFKHTNQNGVAYGGLYFKAANAKQSQEYVFDYYTEKFIKYWEQGEDYDFDQTTAMNISM